jgi:1-acyl-sn-glycerol-3-phosphate acyltransferase
MLRATLIVLFLVPYPAVASVIGIAVARVTGSVRLMYRFGHWGVRVALRLAGTRVEMLGRERFGDPRNTVVVSNHVSHLDAPILFRELGTDFKAIVKREIFSWPLFGRVLERAGFVAVDRRDRTRSLHALSAASASLAAGHCFLVFPEGTRSRTGELGVFKKGAFVAAIDAKSRIVPVALSGTGELMPRGGFSIRAGTVRVEVLDPVDAGLYSYRDRERLVADVRERILRALKSADERRGEPQPA